MGSVRLLRRVAVAEMRTSLARNTNSEASCCVASKWARHPAAELRQVSPFSSAAARPDAGHIVRSPFQDLMLPSDVSLMGHMFDDFGRYGDLTAVVSVAFKKVVPE